jgi:hypothetical protein
MGQREKIIFDNKFIWENEFKYITDDKEEKTRFFELEIL